MTGSARDVALGALRRIDEEGAYANLALRGELDRSGLDARDRAFVTELVYGVTRMRRACDYAVDRFTVRETDGDVRRLLRLGAYQLQFMGVPAHAAVGETVALAPRKVRGFVNAILRRVADNPVVWPDDATRLSEPDWIVERLVADLGRDDALGALDAMNAAATVTRRDDDYVQDLASQWVAAAVEAQPGELVVDLCAAPGGKSTAIASTGASVLAMDVHPARTRLVAENARRTGWPGVHAVTADGRRPPVRRATADRVLVDAPCSGLGALRRRPDARWRIRPEDVDALATLQRELLDVAVELVRPGGTLVYSVCTLTVAETIDVDAHVAARHPELVAVDRPAGPWRPWGRGALVLPQDAGTDGMALFRYRVPG